MNEDSIKNFINLSYPVKRIRIKSSFIRVLYVDNLKYYRLDEPNQIRSLKIDLHNQLSRMFPINYYNIYDILDKYLCKIIAKPYFSN